MKIEQGVITVTPVESAFYKYLNRIPRPADDRVRHKECQEKFKEAIMSDPSITKENLVDFLNDHASTWSFNREVLDMGGPIPID